MPKFSHQALRFEPAAFAQDDADVLEQIKAGYKRIKGVPHQSHDDLIKFALGNMYGNIIKKYDYHLSFFTMWYPLKALLKKHGFDFGEVTRANEVAYFGQDANDITIINMALKAQEIYRKTYFYGSEEFDLYEYDEDSEDDDGLDASSRLWKLNDTDMRAFFNMM